MSRSRHHFEKSLPYNESRGCPTGYHKRTSYLSYLGLKVPSRCIRSTSVYKSGSKNLKRRERPKSTRRQKLHIPSVKSLSRKVCPPGMIERKAYARTYSTAVRERGFTVRRASGTTYKVYPKAKDATVKSRCVKDTGKPKNPTKKIGPLRKGELAKHGYSYKSSSDSRHSALRHAIGEYGVLGVYRKLDAVAKLSKTKKPEASKVFKADRDWVNSTHGPMKAFKH